MPTLLSVGGGTNQNTGYQAALQQSQNQYQNAIGGYNLAPGGLPFGAMQGAGQFDFSGNPASLGANYQNAYQGALGFNSALGNQINQGYGQLSNNVQNTIQGMGSSQQQAINDQYAQQSGQAMQGLINSGLGNSTVTSSVQRGIDLDKAKAGNNLANQMAGLSAGYQSQIGGQQLGFLNSIQAPYPNAALYGQLAQQWGAAQQSNANRAQADDQFKQLLAASRQSLGGGAGVASGGLGTGYMPRSAPIQSVGYGGQQLGGGPGAYPSQGGAISPYSVAPDPLAYGAGGDYSTDFGTGNVGGFWNQAGNQVLNQMGDLSGYQDLGGGYGGYEGDPYIYA